MPKLIILGSSNAVPDEHHENTHMAVVGKVSSFLIDCASTPAIRLNKAGVQLDDITDIILTHFHPDHVSGVPLLLMDMWLKGRRNPLTIHGLAHTLDRLESLMDFYDWEKWPNFFQVTFNRIPEKNMTLVLEGKEWRVFCSPVRHLIPNIGLRIEFLEKGKVIAYSSDTEPCQQVVQLAQGADILIHESTGNAEGHSTPQQAGQIANQAEVKNLYLIHYPARDTKTDSWISAAKSEFYGPISMAEDFMTFDF